MCCTKCKNSETVSNKTLPLVILEMQWSHFQWSYEIIEAFYFHFISTYWTLFIPCDQDKTMGNTKAVDDLVTQGTRASAAMVSRLHEINLCVFHEKFCQPHAAFQSCWMILKTNAWLVLKISRCNSGILKCFFLMAAIKIIAIKQKQMGLLILLWMPLYFFLFRTYQWLCWVVHPWMDIRFLLHLDRNIILGLFPCV